MKHTKLITIAIIACSFSAIFAKKLVRPRKEFFRQDLEKSLTPKRGIQKKGPSEITSRTGFLPKDKAPRKKSRRKNKK